MNPEVRGGDRFPVRRNSADTNVFEIVRQDDGAVTAAVHPPLDRCLWRVSAAKATYTIFPFGVLRVVRVERVGAVEDLLAVIRPVAVGVGDVGVGAVDICFVGVEEPIAVAVVGPAGLPWVGCLSGRWLTEWPDCELVYLKMASKPGRFRCAVV
jgi:hypothetical protein